MKPFLWAYWMIGRDLIVAWVHASACTFSCTGTQMASGAGFDSCQVRN